MLVITIRIIQIIPEATALHSKNFVTFDLYTNFSGEYQVGSAWVYLADLALDLDGLPGYEIGIVLRDHDTWINSYHQPSLKNTEAGDIFTNVAWESSADYWEDIPGSYSYGGEANPGNPHPSWVAVGNGSTDTNQNATVSFEDISGDAPNYKYSVEIHRSALPGYFC